MKKYLGHVMEINWKYYLSLDSWSEHQAGCLLFRVDPTWLTEHEQVQNKFLHLSGATRLNAGLNLERAEAQKLVNKIERAKLELNQDVVTGIIIPNDIQIKMKVDPFDYDFPSYVTYSKQNAYFFKPVKFITWANSKNYEVPKELTDFVEGINLLSEKLQTKAVDNEKASNQTDNNDIRVSQLHKFFWRVYQTLTTARGNEKVTAQKVWLEITHRHQEHDEDNIIDEVANNIIHWHSRYGRYQKFQGSSFDKTLSKLKKNPPF